MKTPNHHRLSVARIPQRLFGRCERGFTMVELMLTVTVLGILLAVGVPSFRSMVINMRIKNASFDVYSSILAARSEAMTRNATTVTITPTAGSNWAAGWDIKVIPAPTPPAPDILKTQNAFPGIIITGPATLVYNSSGRVSTAANCPAASPTKVCVMVAKTDAPTVPVRCVAIDLSGRPVSKLPTSGECQ